MADELNIEYIDLDKLKPYEKNARAHTKDDVSAIKASIEQFGMNDPIGIWSDKNIIVEGHGRLEALKQLGYSQAPCIRLDHLTDEQRKAYALAHNKTAELSAWDNKVLKEELASLTNFDMGDFGFEFEDISKIKEDMKGTAEILEDEEPDSKPGAIYKLGEHFLICGDSTQQETFDRLFSAAKVKEADLLLTDPPYGVDYGDAYNAAAKLMGKKQREDRIENDNLDDTGLIKFLTDYQNLAKSRLKDGGVFYEFYACMRASAFWKAHEQSGLEIHQNLIWQKSHFVIGFSDYQWSYEPIFYGWKDGASHYFYNERDLRTSIILQNEPKWEDLTKEEIIALIAKAPKDVVEFKKPAKSEYHPTQKPIELMSFLVRNSSKKGEVVLDCFGGSGSTMVAAEKLGRKCLMIEKDPKYCDAIIQRYADVFGVDAEVFDDGGV